MEVGWIEVALPVLAVFSASDLSQSCYQEVVPSTTEYLHIWRTRLHINIMSEDQILWICQKSFQNSTNVTSESGVERILASRALEGLDHNRSL